MVADQEAGLKSGIREAGRGSLSERKNEIEKSTPGIEGGWKKEDDTSAADPKGTGVTLGMRAERTTIGIAVAPTEEAQSTLMTAGIDGPQNKKGTTVCVWKATV